MSDLIAGSHSDGSTPLGTASLSNGSASYRTSALPAGTDSLTAAYNGNSIFESSTSQAVTVTVGSLAAAATITTLTMSATTATQGTALTLNASVASVSGNAVPTGTVTFYSGTTALGSATLSSGSVTMQTAALPVGTGAMTASYAGGNGFGASTSTVASVTITQAAIPDFTLTASPFTISVAGDQSATTTLTLTPSNGFNEAVTLSCRGLPVGDACSFSSSAAQANGTSTVKVTITTQVLAAVLSGVPMQAPLYALLPFAGFGMRRRRSTRGLRHLALAGVLLLPFSGLLGCGGAVSTSSNGNSGPAPQTSTVTITATTASGISHSTQLTLTVR